MPFYCRSWRYDPGVGFPVDLHTWRVYSAEQSLPVGQVFESADEARTYLWWVQSTRWWKETFVHAPTIELEIAGDATQTDAISFARSVGPGRSIISLHPRMMNSIVLLHEIAHCVSPKATGDPDQLRKGVLAYRPFHNHGSMFRAAFCVLAERYRVGVVPDDLRLAYAHFELEVASENDLFEACAKSPEVATAFAELMERARIAREEREELKRAAADTDTDTAAQQDLEDTPLWGSTDVWWGSWLATERRLAKPMLSQTALAQRISKVMPCTQKTVSRVEHLKAEPHGLSEKAVALASAAIHNMDPVWIETALGLAPSTNTLTLDRLDEIAPDWVSVVRHLNALVDARPPRWEASGNR